MSSLRPQRIAPEESQASGGHGRGPNTTRVEAIHFPVFDGVQGRSSLLALQRMAGNTAVGALLGRSPRTRGANDPSFTAARGLVDQRCGEHHPYCGTGHADGVGAGVRALPGATTPIAQRANGKPKPPPKPTFTLSGRTFIVDGTTIKAKSRDGGWKFTPSAASAATGPAAGTPGAADSTSTSPGGTTAPAPAPPVEFAAERTMPDSDYLSAAGVSSSLSERTQVTVAAGKVTVEAPVALFPTSGAPQLTITLGSNGAPSTQPLAVGTQSADALEVSMTGLTPTDGDTLRIFTNNRKELYVFSTLKPATGPAVQGFFDIGKRAVYKGTVGVAGEGRTKAGFDSTFGKLAAAGKLSAAIRAQKEIFSATAEIEGGFDTTQTYDTGVFTFGFGQWTANASLPQMLKVMPDDVFNQHLGQYGLGRDTPALGTEQQMRKFVTPKEWGAANKKGKFALRNTSEGSITLNGKELISANAYALAQTWSAKYDALATELAAVKADLAGTDAAKAKLAGKTIDTRWAQLAGLPGIPKIAPPRTSAGQKADTLIAQVTVAKAEADKVVAGAELVEAIRTNEWVLRFQVAGQDPAVQVAQLEHAHATLEELNKRTAGTGAHWGTLLPTDRGQSVLISTHLNNPSSVRAGLQATVPAFRKQKVDEADKFAKEVATKVEAVAKGKDADKIAEATKVKEAADESKTAWEKFPWPKGDGRWATYYTTAAADQFEEIAEPKMLRRTTDPARRADIMNRHFSP